ncbi:hypothetical protein F543_21720 [Bibersteinia trehalosi USDA-ARS-USMARC-189]|uniref:Transferrin-binding protein B C-lobe/N-lobe beta-barrel domain-containing protein n=1 Tax=Bibersteinia trehalosi USDA-ARS-USMARC-189 TaxID=1263831 RepID=A0ABM5PFR5_BIBTR|nr:transferrin-binding protein-like solute binding protein [Bibersteinia trehalosi]AGH37500.1 hypothetical protein WQG_2140 [Bibersteinia trehalosi USDA-ARS-USMARC-192]AHG85027.1 hypothetical protein F543_21720 [Bibersteinia trehalosi USDA-ARS-USMARC-189]
MQKLHFSFITTACALMLSACSSSSGGGNGTAPIFLTEIPDSSNNTQPATPSVTPPNAGNTSADHAVQPNTEDNTPKLTSPMFSSPKDARLTGAILSINSANGSVSGKNLHNVEKETLESLFIDNVEIALKTLAAEDEQRGFNSLTTADQKHGSLGEISGAVNKTSIYSLYDQSVYQFVRFGVINSNSHSHLFVQGLQTPIEGVWSEIDNGHANLYPMPKSGKFVYKKGDALYGKAGNYSALSAEVRADFNQKQLNVSLKDGQTEKLAFSAAIEGNTFNGNSHGVESKGAFYGSGANQVGGVFYESQSQYNGVFGATDKRPDDSQ